MYKEIEKLREVKTNLPPKDAEFANSLIDQFSKRGHLSEKQWPWVRTLVERASSVPPDGRPCAGPTSEVSVAGLGPIVELFDKAAVNLKYPKIEFNNLKLTRAGGRAKEPGAINVTDGAPYGQNVWYGKISRNGTFVANQRVETPDAVIEFLKRMAKDPVAVAKEYGLETGNCCFCSRVLTNENSLAVGYGPICADHYGLPHGSNQ